MVLRPPAIVTEKMKYDIDVMKQSTLLTELSKKQTTTTLRKERKRPLRATGGATKKRKKVFTVDIGDTSSDSDS